MYFGKGKKNEFAMRNHILKVTVVLEGAVTSKREEFRNVIKAHLV